MRKSLLALSFAFLTMGMNAQQFVKASGAMTPAKYDRTVATGFETVRPDVPAAENALVNSRTGTENVIGTTTYDLQSNNSTRNSLARHTDGTLAATWTMGNSTGDGYSDRGTGYNYFDGSNWGDQPSARIESVRTGWGSVAMLGDGSQFIVAHSSNNEYITNRNASGTWVQGVIPTAIPVGVLWPRAAAGGPDGMTVHVIGISTPSGLGGGIWENLDGHLVYFRSLDGGATWDKQDVKVPGMDDTKYRNFKSIQYFSSNMVSYSIFYKRTLFRYNHKNFFHSFKFFFNDPIIINIIQITRIKTKQRYTFNIYEFKEGYDIGL